MLSLDSQIIKKGPIMMTLSTTNVPAEVERKILTAIELKKELEKYEREIKDALFEAMKANNIVSIKNDSYTVSLATRTNYTAQDISVVAPELRKEVLDTTKVRSTITLTGELPEGVEVSETEYLTWRAK